MRKLPGCPLLPVLDNYLRGFPHRHRPHQHTKSDELLLQLQAAIPNITPKTAVSMAAFLTQRSDTTLAESLEVVSPDGVRGRAPS